VSTIIKPITASENAERHERIEGAMASVRLAGLEPTAGARAIAERYISGEISVDQMVEEVRLMYAQQFGSANSSEYR
jgi:Antitoxin VbhA